MKIAFIGTHGVGKTTLCFDLAAHMKRIDVAVDLVMEVARDCPLPINRDTTLDAQTWILHTQIARELVSSGRHQTVICDRSVLDNYAYLVHKIGRRDDLDTLVGTWIQGYTTLFKVPVWRPPTFDGLRDTGMSFQKDIDRTIDGLIEDFRVPIVRLDRATAPDWLAEVLNHLDLPARTEQVSLFPEES